MAEMRAFAAVLLVLFAAAQLPARSLGERFGSRQLQQFDPVDSGLTVGEASVFQVASGTFGPLNAYPQSGWIVSNISATLELDTEATYANNFRVDSPTTWAAGMTRLNVTVNLTQTSSTSGNAMPPSISVKVHTASCGSDNFLSSLLSANNTGNTSSLSGALGVSMSSIGTRLVNSTTFNFLVDYDEAKAVGIYGTNNFIGCQNLRPPFPDFPNDWSSTIEITDVERGVTFVMQEAYSQSLNLIRADVHTLGVDRIIVTNLTAAHVTTIVPSNGSCSGYPTGRVQNWITGDDNETLVSTAEMLHFTDPSTINFVPGIVDVRGIPCEVWQASVEFTRRNFSMAFDVEFYFPINQWLVAREDYHRLLKRVHMNGTRNGQAFETYFEYVNFRPRTFYNAYFDTCAISPYGSNCNCTDKLRRAAFANLTAALSEGDDVTVASAANAACDVARPVPHGFISAQSGPYVGLTIIGMIGGSLITGAVMYFYYRKRVGVRITDNLGHTKFTDAPGT